MPIARLHPSQASGAIQRKFNDSVIVFDVRLPQADAQQKAGAQMANHTEKAQWAEIRMLMRLDLLNILQNIEAGHVTDMELDKLNNFCMVALVLLSKVEQRTWAACFKQAEISALLNNEEDLP